MWFLWVSCVRLGQMVFFLSLPVFLSAAILETTSKVGFIVAPPRSLFDLLGACCVGPWVCWGACCWQKLRLVFVVVVCCYSTAMLFLVVRKDVWLAIKLAGDFAEKCAFFLRGGLFWWVLDVCGDELFFCNPFWKNKWVVILSLCCANLAFENLPCCAMTQLLAVFAGGVCG